MGNLVSGALDANMKKQQEFMLETQRLQMERQMVMQNMMRERMMAMQIGRSQELFYWTGAFGSLIVAGCSARFQQTKKPVFLLPLIPVGFVLGYQWHMAFGDKMIVIRRHADALLDSRPDLFDLPLGPVTFGDVEERRIKARNDATLHRPHDVFL